MKTAISLPDELFVLADNFARQRGLSRSELYTKALRQYMDDHRQDDLTEQINRACANLETALPPDRANVARRRVLSVEW